MSRLALAPFFLLAIFAPAAAAAGVETAGATFPVSVTAAGEYADLGTGQPVSISTDGRYVAFVSRAANLAADAPADIVEAYVKDLDTGALLLASRAGGAEGEPANEPPPGEQPHTGIERALISADGRYVLFTSRATNLAGDELPLPEEEAEEFFSTHVYRRDLQTGETALVDRETGPDGATHPLEARGEAISADGRYVVFRAEAPDLGDPDGEHESTGSGTIYVRDMQTGTTTAVSRASGEEGEMANARSAGGAISPDGSHVAFDTFATNPGLGGEENEATQVYVRDLQAPLSTVLSSRSSSSGGAPDGEQANGESFEAAFLGASCRVGFTSEATNLALGGGSLFQAYVRDSCSGPPSTTVVGLDAEGAAFAEAVLLGGSGDGTSVLITGESFPDLRHLYLRDLSQEQTTLLDRASGDGAAADHGVEDGAISANGCRVAFSSPATNLTADPPPAGGSAEQLQVFIRQLGPCHPPSGKGPAGGEVPATHPGPLKVSIVALRPPHLRLHFSATGKATVRIDRRAGRAGHRHWRRLASIVLSAPGAGRVDTLLPDLDPGRYRLRVRPNGPESRAVRRLFTVAPR